MEKKLYNKSPPFMMEWYVAGTSLVGVALAPILFKIGGTSKLANFPVR